MATWTFAPNGEGEDQGFHNPGVETFKGPLERYLAREAIQNSIDARFDKSKPVRVSFDLLTLDRSEVPGMADLAETLVRCGSFWHRDKHAIQFFDRARKMATASKITCLRIGDANATGVHGTDLERDKDWYHLVRCSGASSKGGGEGGSFGLGKHAPFAGSRLRTVFYSTWTDSNTSSFQGVARLVTHEGKKGRCQPTGYLGGPGGRSVRNKKDIPKAFRRDEPGTDVFVLGYHPDENWQDQFIRSVLENFFPAVHRSDLTVKVGDTLVTKKNLAQLMAQFSVFQDFDTHLYYRAYTDPAAVATATSLPTLGEATVRLLVGDPNSPNNVAMVRGSGMVVYWRRGRSRVPYCGVFECRDAIGNQKLRDMEPPRHDDWNADLPEKGENRNTKKELDDHIIECVRALAPTSNEKTLVIPELSQYLPDDGESPEDAFDGPSSDGTGSHESFEQTPKAQAIPGRRMGRTPPTRPGGTTPGEGDIEAGGDAAGRDGGEQNDGTGGDKGTKGGGEEESGISGGEDGRTPVLVRSRAFLRNPEHGLYSVTVYPPIPRPSREVYLSVAAVGDDAIPTAVQLSGARSTGNRKLEVSQYCRVGPVSFPKTGPLRLEVILLEPRRLALDVTAYEVPAHEAE